MRSAEDQVERWLCGAKAKRSYHLMNLASETPDTDAAFEADGVIMDPGGE
jgi:hypothetical protein